MKKLKELLNHSSSGLFWNLDNGRIYKHGVSYWAVYGDTTIGKHYFTNGADTAIGQYFFNNGADTKFGLPKANEVSQLFNAWQEFELTTINWWNTSGVSVSIEPLCPATEPEVICPEVNTTIPQACAVPTKKSYTSTEDPVLEIVHGSALKLTIEFTLDKNVDNTNHFTYKTFDVYPDGDGKFTYAVPPTLLWNNSKKDQVVRVYYRITSKLGPLADNDAHLAYYPLSNDFQDSASFDIVVRTPEFINPMEGDPRYRLGGGIGSYVVIDADGNITYIHPGIDIEGKEGGKVGASKKGKVIQIFTGNADAATCTIPSKIGKPQMIVTVEHDNGIYTRYMHMNNVRLTLNQEIDLNGDLGTVDDIGCASEGYDHLHFEARSGSMLGTVVNPETDLNIILR